MSMINTLRKIKRNAYAGLLRMKMRSEAKRAFRYDIKQFMDGAGALHLDRKAAACSEIVMAYHVLEKGLTMPHRRLGFGKGAVLHLINLVTEFERRFGCEDTQVRHAVGVLRAYKDLHKDWLEPMPRLSAFLERHPEIQSATQPHVRREDFFSAHSAEFPKFAASRHVCRHFAAPIPRKTMEDAIALALTAPSACNRQHARVHVIDSREVRDALFAIQGGTRGFGHDADKVIVVTADLSAIRWAWERHDAYTNGGIFVMNLCYALHYHGIAHCILHWSVSPEKDRAAHDLLGIPANEVIVQVLACGLPPDEFDVASSPRRDLKEVMTWHSHS